MEDLNRNELGRTWEFCGYSFLDTIIATLQFSCEFFSQNKWKWHEHFGKCARVALVNQVTHRLFRFEPNQS